MEYKKKTYVFKIIHVQSGRFSATQFQTRLTFRDFDDKVDLHTTFLTEFEIIDAGNLSIKALLPEEE